MQGDLSKEKRTAQNMVEELGRKEGSFQRLTEALLEVSTTPTAWKGDSPSL